MRRLRIRFSELHKIICITVLLVLNGCTTLDYQSVSEEISNSPKLCFQGLDLVGVGPFDVKGDQKNGQIIVVEPRFELALPYATDWGFILVKTHALFSHSEQHGLVVSVTTHPMHERIEPKTFLLLQLREHEKRAAISDGRILTADQTPCLVYKSDDRTDFWWVLQSRKLQVFRLHISTRITDSTKIAQLLDVLKPLVQNGFKVKE